MARNWIRQLGRASCALILHSLLALPFSQSIKDNYIFFRSPLPPPPHRPRAFPPFIAGTGDGMATQLLTQQFYIVWGK